MTPSRVPVVGDMLLADYWGYQNNLLTAFLQARSMCQ